MALTKCRECGKDVSTEAEKCPHCGVPFKSKKGGMGCGTAVLVIIGVIVLAYIIGDRSYKEHLKKRSTTVYPPPQTETEETKGILDLKAYVKFTGTHFVLKNLDNFHWDNCTFKINSGLFAGGYELKAGNVEPLKEYEIPAVAFTKSDGTRFNPLATAPKHFFIYCETSEGTGSWGQSWD